MRGSTRIRRRPTPREYSTPAGPCQSWDGIGAKPGNCAALGHRLRPNPHILSNHPRVPYTALDQGRPALRPSSDPMVTTHSPFVSLTAAAAILSMSCGPTSEQRQLAREAERERAAAASEQEFQDFAERHEATPNRLLAPLGPALTLQLQDSLEGSLVAFEALLLDVVRTSPSEYRLVLSGGLLLRGTFVSLVASDETIAPLLRTDPGRFANLRVAAQIQQVVPLTLKLEACRETECDDVTLEPSMIGQAHRISGRLVALELKDPGTRHR